ncbi:MAG: signal peptidase I [Ignavibacteria bacterium]|nr:signal peptidase I [Ignavibacteria bacterium]
MIDMNGASRESGREGGNAASTLDEQLQNEESPKQAVSPARTGVISYVKTILFTIFIALMLKTFVIEAYRIPSGSMENTLLAGDFLFVNKFVYGLRTPRYVPLTSLAIPSVSLPAFRDVQRGDVIVFEFPADHAEMSDPESLNYIKRCIGLPGDTVWIVSGRVFVNGRELVAPTSAKAMRSAWHGRLERGLCPAGAGFSKEEYGPLVVPKKGDLINVASGNLDRWKGFIEEEGHTVEADAAAVVRIDGVEMSSYRVERNYYFVLGDNRQNSLDSRYWGFVPDQNLIGEALLIYWSWDPAASASSLSEKFKTIRWDRIGNLIR